MATSGEDNDAMAGVLAVVDGGRKAVTVGEGLMLSMTKTRKKLRRRDEI